MPSCSVSTTTNHNGGATPITALHQDVIQSHILNRLDGPTLAATSCASSELLSLCNNDQLWKNICNSTWPSTANPRVAAAISACHRSFYHDSFPNSLINTTATANSRQNPNYTTPELISAVDIFHGDEPIYSKVLVTETQSTWFLGLPFRLDLLDPKETLTATRDPRAAEGFRVSWILIDPSTKRAINVASGSPVEVITRRQWHNVNDDEVQLRYATVVGSGEGLVQLAVLVTCGGKDGHVIREVCMQVESIEGKVVPGMESLGILREAMEGSRTRVCSQTERDLYEMFVGMREQLKERKMRRERGLDMACVLTGVSILVSFLVFLVVSSR